MDTVFVEFIPKTDPKVQGQLADRLDVLSDDYEDSFEKELSTFKKGFSRASKQQLCKGNLYMLRMLVSKITFTKFALFCCLVVSPFVLFFLNNFAQLLFFDTVFLYFTFAYCIPFFTLYYFIPERFTPLVLFIASISFLQFYHYDLRFFPELKYSGTFALVLIGFLSFLIAYLSQWTIFRNFLLFSLLINIGISLTNFSLKPLWQQSKEISSSALKNSMEDEAPSSTFPSPNIFYIVPDGLASPRILQKNFGVELNQSVGKLSAHGFSVLEHGYSSYNLTHLTLASLFDMSYPVTDVSEIYNSRSAFYPSIREKKSKLLQYLKSNKYKFFQFPPNWGGCSGNIEITCFKPADSYLINSNYAISTMLSNSFLKLFFNRIFVSDPSDIDDAGKTALNVMSKKHELWSEGGIFTMIHMMIPHSPYRHQDCSLIDAKSYTTDREAYGSSALCAINRIEELSEFIIKHHPNSAIVIQSDHGVWPTDEKFKDTRRKMLFVDSPKSFIESRISFFSAAYGCNSDEAVKINQANIVKFIVQCLKGQSDAPTYNNRSYFGYYEDHPEFGRVFKVTKD